MPSRKALLSVLAAPALLGGACLFGSDEPPGYAHQGEAVIIHVATVQPAEPPLAGRLPVPALTLYGDGTLILTRPGDGGRLGLVQAHLPEDAVAGLLDTIVDEHFLDAFVYLTAARDPAGSYIYVNTADGTNAVKVPPPDAGREAALTGVEREQLERTRRVESLLTAFDPAAVGGERVGDAAIESVTLVVAARSAANTAGAGPWPFGAIDLAGAIRAGAEAGEVRITGQLVAGLMEELTLGEARRFRQGDGVFDVGYRPVLPHEERLPEFDLPRNGQ